MDCKGENAMDSPLHYSLRSVFLAEASALITVLSVKDRMVKAH